MKKVSIIKGIFVILLSIMLIGATNVFAVDVDEEDEDGEEDVVIWGDENVNSTPATEKSTITPTENTTANNTVANNTAVNNTTASVYNNTVNTPNSLAKAGLEESIPTMALIVLFGISAVYAYKKIKDYKNI